MDKETFKELMKTKFGRAHIIMATPPMATPPKVDFVLEDPPTPAPMSQSQVFCRDTEYADRAAVEAAYPAAAVIVEVEGGWMAFATRQDHDTWANQL